MISFLEPLPGSDQNHFHSLFFFNEVTQMTSANFKGNEKIQALRDD